MVIGRCSVNDVSVCQVKVPVREDGGMMIVRDAACGRFKIGRLAGWQVWLGLAALFLVDWQVPG